MEYMEEIESILEYDRERVEEGVVDRELDGW
jgi:hypothetical protein